MKFASVIVFLLCINAVNAAAIASDARRLRGLLQEIHLFPRSAKFVEKVGWGPGPGPVGEKPEALKQVEALHDDWWLPLASLKNFVLATWIELIISAAIWMTLVLLAAIMYKRSARYSPEVGPKPLDPARTQSDLTEWQSEWYQCYRYPEIFFWSCCCPCVRWAHTMDLLQFLDYWPAFFIFFILEAMNQLTAFILIGVFLTMILVFYRQKTRKLFGIANYGTCTGYTTDCLGLLCCWPCFIAQEAHHVAQAAKLGWTKDLAVRTGLFSARFTSSASMES